MLNILAIRLLRKPKRFHFRADFSSQSTQKSQKNLAVEVFGVTLGAFSLANDEHCNSMDEGSRMARDRSHDTERCPFSIGPVCKAVDGKFNGPTAKLLQDGYLTYQMVTIRRLCDIDSKVISLRRALMEAAKEEPAFKAQIDQLLDSLKQCDHVCRQVDKHVVHTAKSSKTIQPSSHGIWECSTCRLHTRSVRLRSSSIEIFCTGQTSSKSCQCHNTSLGKI